MIVKILNLNLWEGGLLWDNIVSLIEREQPDILCLQEAGDADENQPENFRTLQRFEKVLPDFYSYFSPELYQIWPDGSQGDAGNLILSRFPIKEQKTIFLHGSYERIIRDDAKGYTHYPKNMQHVVLDIEGKDLHVCNMHGIWEMSGKDSPERLRMSHLMLEEIGESAPHLLMGDFNLTPDTQTIHLLEEKLTNVFAGEMTTSFNMRHKTNPDYGTAVVDMVFATHDVQVISKEVLEDDVSDHKALLIAIRL